MIAVRSDDRAPALVMVSPERLRELADGRAAEVPKVNGTHLHPDCQHCDEDGQV